ncbi:MAG: YqiJ family protein [Epsilonproteobacteria bacterium]|nr:YqiJ family protein [Campylobacterota bacterium]
MSEVLSFAMSNQNILFFTAIVLFLLIAVLEGLLTLIGFGFSSFLDSLAPDFDLDTELDITESKLPALTEFFGWVNKGRVPVLMLFILFLMFFGIYGLLLQALTGMIFSQYLVAIPAFFLTLVTIRVSSVYIAKVIPKDESSAISEESFIGYSATIVIGQAKLGRPAEAKFVDVNAHTQYIMVEPVEDVVFKQGDEVLIVKKEGAIFKVTAPVESHFKDSL